MSTQISGLDSQFGERLRSERKRLKMTIESFATELGIARNTQINYESGATTPDADYLARSAQIGVDLATLFGAAPGKAEKYNNLYIHDFAQEAFQIVDGHRRKMTEELMALALRAQPPSSSRKRKT
jgi:transcriptional regulator with XRE-family HTH domain